MGCFSEVLTKFKTLLGLRNEGNGEAAEFSPLGQDKHMFFKMENLIAATGNFDETNKLGEGGFGPVYKGILENGREIAVKKLSVESKQGRKEFLSEIKLVAKVQHRNLVSLIGCCAEGSERLLVYEYLPNSSLDRVLFDSRKHKQLDWQKRYNIIMGIARGLLYLHEDSQLRIIHRDIKASNILLDERWHPKIADFGLARLYPDDKTHISTRVAGTYGYMAPEYFTQGKCSLKVDIYSFGVLLLEIVCGRKNTDYSASEGMECLLKWAWKSHKKGTLEALIDPDIKRTCPIEQAVRCIHIGLLCTQGDDTSRPAMSTVTLMLSSHSVRLPNITKPAFYPTARRNSKSSSSSHAVTHVSHGSSRTSATSSSASAFSSQTPTIHSS